MFTAALAVGNAQAAYDAALRYARERVQFGQPIGKFQTVQFKLVDMLATLEQTRLYTYYVAGRADRGEEITKEAALAKLAAADSCHEVCEKALNIFGGYGLMNEYPGAAFPARFLLPDHRRRHQRHHAPDRGAPARPLSAAPGIGASPKCFSSESCRASTSLR